MPFSRVHPRENSVERDGILFPLYSEMASRCATVQRTVLAVTYLSPTASSKTLAAPAISTTANQALIYGFNI